MLWTEKAGRDNMRKAWPLYLGTSKQPWLGGDCWSVRLVALRATLFLIMLSVLVASVVRSVQAGCLADWPLYLTHIILVIQVVYLGLSAWTTFVSREALSVPMVPPLPRTGQMVWALQDTQLVGTWFVAVAFWSFLAPTNHTWKYAWTTHGLNFGVAVVDAMTRREIALIRRCVTFLLVAACYTVLTILFWWFHGTNCEGHHWLYKGLNYSDPQVWALVALAIPATFVFYTACCWLLDMRSDLPSRYDRPSALSTRLGTLHQMA